MCGDEIGDGDDPVATSHDSVVGAFGGAASAIGAVEGGDESNARTPGRRSRAPCRRARTGVDKVHLFPCDQGFQSSYVAPEQERVLGIDRKADMVSAELHCHSPASRDDQRSRAGVAQGSGDLQRAPFDAACLQRREHLKHGPALKFGFAGR